MNEINDGILFLFWQQATLAESFSLYPRLSHWLSESKLRYVSRPVYFTLKPHLVPKTRFLSLSDSYMFVVVEHPLWREVGFVTYNCFWTSPAHSHSGPSPAGLMTIFYCLRFETAPTRPAVWSAYIASAWIAQRRPLPTVLLLLLACPLPR
jgi:hypothetical protein